MKAKFLYTGIRVRNLDKSIDFYTKLFGMKLLGRAKIDGAGGEVASLASEDGGHELELNHYIEGTKFASNYVVGEGLDHLAFKVEGGLDNFLADARAAGHPTVLEVKTEKSRWAYIEDPNGIWIELFG